MGVYNKEYYIKNKGKYQVYYKNNKEDKIIYSKNYYKNNKEKVKEYRRNYYQNNKEKIKEYNDKNRESMNMYKRKYRLLKKLHQMKNRSIEIQNGNFIVSLN